MKYTVRTDTDLVDLIKYVQKLIDEGWQPLGGVSNTSVAGTSLIIYAQTLIKPGALRLPQETGPR